MSEWREVRLGDCVAVNKQTLPRDYQGKIRYIDISSVSEGVLNGYNEIEYQDAPSRARRLIEDGDIIYSTVRPNLKGYYKFNDSLMENTVVSTGFIVLSKTKYASIDYIYYYITEDSFVNYLINVAKGAAYPAVGIDDFKKAKIRVPNLETQRKIANVLSTYDKLIENNNRRIQILEQTAEELYKEWFVRMRFPGYEKTKFDKGIPEGWEVKKIKDVIDKLESGRRPKNIEVTSSKETVVSLGAGDIKGLGEYSYSNEYLVPLDFYQSLNRGKIKDKDIAIYKDGAYTGKVTMFRDNFPYEKMAINEHVFLVKCKEEIMQNYLLFTLKQSSYYELMQALSMTSAQPGLNQTNFKNIKIQIPNNPLLIMFHEKTEYFLQEIFNLAKQNQTLINQRDLLLPRLMNGTITVK